MTDTEIKEEIISLIRKGHSPWTHTADKIMELTKRPQDNNALVPLDSELLAEYLFKTKEIQSTMLQSKTGCQFFADLVCAKFGKDNSGMVPLDKKSWDEAVIVLESEMLRIIRSKHPASGQLFNHPEDVVSWTAKLLYKRFSQQPPKERKVSLEEIKIIKSVLDYYNLTEDGFYTDIISEEIAKRLNAVLDGKEGGVNGTKI